MGIIPNVADLQFEFGSPQDDHYLSTYWLNLHHALQSMINNHSYYQINILLISWLAVGKIPVGSPLQSRCTSSMKIARQAGYQLQINYKTSLISLDTTKDVMATYNLIFNSNVSRKLLITKIKLLPRDSNQEKPRFKNKSFSTLVVFLSI